MTSLVENSAVERANGYFFVSDRNLQVIQGNQNIHHHLFAEKNAVPNWLLHRTHALNNGAENSTHQMEI